METKMKSMSVDQAVEKVAAAPVDARVREYVDRPIGWRIHQGDVYLTRVNLNHPRGEKLGSRQVAVGTTVGARHFVEGAGVEVYKGERLPPKTKCPSWANESDMIGPLVIVRDGNLRLTHPEHAEHHCTWTEKGDVAMQVTYQLDRTTMRRVED